MASTTYAREEPSLAVEIGFRFPDREFYLDPVRVDEYVRALGIEPEIGYRPGIGAPVPPGFLMYVTTYGAEPIHDALGLDPLRTVYGGMDEEFLAPARVGERLTVRPQVTNVTSKTGQSGALLFIELTIEYVRDDGTVIVRERSNTVQRG